MTTSYRHRLVWSMIVTLISGSILALSLAGENSEAYLFPTIAAFSMFCLSLLSLLREAMRLCSDDYKPFPLISQIPAIAVMTLGVLSIESIGMYESTFLILLLISYWYSPIENFRSRFLRSLMFAGGFSAVMYVLFSLVLNVQFSRGLLI